MTFRLRAMAVLGAATLALAACSSSVKLDENEATAPIENRGAATTGAGATTASGNEGSTRRVEPVVIEPKDPLNDPTGALAKRSVYFDFDSYVVKEQYRGLVDAHGQYLNKNKARKVVVQGNTDDRGSREYNLALGQKRAEAVRKALVVSGAAESQLEAVSFGEEKPKATGNDEAAWAENRRADLAYQ